MSKVCQVIGINHQTYYNHLKSDPWFAHEMEEIRQRKVDAIEGKVFEAAEDSKNFLHQAMVLRAHRPELYDRAKVVRVEGYKMTPSEQKGRLDVVDTVIDSQIAQTYLSRREQRERRQGLKALKAPLSPEKQGGE